jgi:hypothetical protein
VKLPRAKRYPPVGRCIYCGDQSSKLGDEHIIAFALGGKDILPKASCPVCARTINKSFETYCSQRMFQSIRLQHNYPTRNPKDRPTHLPMIETFAADPKFSPTQLVPVADHPGLAVLFAFEPPGILVRQPPADTYRNIQIHPRAISDTDARVKRLLSAGYKGAKTYEEFRIWPFVRLLAKIAHGYAVAEYGVDAFQHLLTHVILEEHSVAPYLVGGTPGHWPPEPVLHRVHTEIHHVGGRSFIIARIRLFAYLVPPVPVYTVVVGELSPTSLQPFDSDTSDDANGN